MADGGSVIFNFKGDTKDLDKATASATSTLSKVGNTALKAAGVITGAMATAFAGVVTASVKARGELEQQIGGTEAVFGEYASQVQEMAKNSFSTMGTSANDYMATINKMGSLMKGSGIETQKAMDLSSKAMQRAADVASVMGIDINSAMESIAGAAKGNFTMMDNLGVAMNATTLEAYAMEKGLNKTYNTMSNAEKIQLAMEMFLDKSAYAAGNYAKENETLAGSVSTLKAAWGNFLSGAGDLGQVVSAATSSIDIILKTVNEAVPQILEQITQNLPKLAETVAKVVPDIVKALVAAIPQLFKTGVLVILEIIDGIRVAIPDLIAMLPDIIEGIIIGLIDLIPEIIDTGIQLLQSLIDGLVQALPKLYESVPRIIQALINGLIGAIPQLIQGAIQLFMAIIQAIPVIISALIENLPKIITTIVNGLLDAIPQIIEGAIQLLMGIIEAIPQIIIALVENLPKIIISIVETLLNNIPKIIEGAIQLFMGIIKAIPKIVITLVQNMPQIIMAILKGLAEGIGKMVEMGGNLIKGLWQGIKDAGQWLWNKITGFLNGIVEKIKSFFGIHSPSKLFENEIGKYMAEGIGVGFEDEMGSVSKDITKSMEDIIPDINDTIGDLYDLSPTLNNATNSSSNVTVQVYNNMETDMMGNLINNIKTFSNGSKNDFNYGLA